MTNLSRTIFYALQKFVCNDGIVTQKVFVRCHKSAFCAPCVQSYFPRQSCRTSRVQHQFSHLKAAYVRFNELFSRLTVNIVRTGHGCGRAGSAACFVRLLRFIAAHCQQILAQCRVKYEHCPVRPVRLRITYIAQRARECGFFGACIATYCRMWYAVY